MTTYELHVIETSDVRADGLEQLKSAIGAALVSVASSSIELAGKERAQHVLTIDRSEMRDTVANGHAYAGGFISHVA